MTTIAVTTNGNITGQVWLNDNSTQTSKLVRSCDMAEIMGDISSEELDSKYADLDALNADLADFTFTEEAEYAAGK